MPSENNCKWIFISKRIQTLREFNGLTHHGFAKKIDSVASQVRHWEEEKGFPSVPTLLKICSEFSVLPSSFFMSDV
jgi:transcriptional regulator with XRE-family HTH domain